MVELALVGRARGSAETDAARKKVYCAWIDEVARNGPPVPDGRRVRPSCGGTRRSKGRDLGWVQLVYRQVVWRRHLGEVSEGLVRRRGGQRNRYGQHRWSGHRQLQDL